MSLGVLNEGNEIPEQYRAYMEQGTRVLRALAAAEAAGGQEGVATLYTALGIRQHEKGDFVSDEVVAEAVAEVGLPASVAAAVDDESLDTAVRSSHDESQPRSARSPVARSCGSTATATSARSSRRPPPGTTPSGCSTRSGCWRRCPGSAS